MLEVPYLCIVLAAKFLCLFFPYILDALCLLLIIFLGSTLQVAVQCSKVSKSFAAAEVVWDCNYDDI